MKTVYDVRQLLKRFGVFIYTGNPIGDLELMEGELGELHRLGLITIHTYQQGLLVLRGERRVIIRKDV